jgi:hypothetical protein
MSCLSAAAHHHSRFLTIEQPHATLVTGVVAHVAAPAAERLLAGHVFELHAKVHQQVFRG